MKPAITRKPDGSVEVSVDKIEELFTKPFLWIFGRRKSEKDFIAELKKKTFEEIITKMKEDGSISYFEFAQCKNFIDIAKMADKYAKQETSGKNETNNSEKEQTKMPETYAIRMFENASRCFDDEVKDVWARLMASTITNKGKYHLKTLEILNQITSEDLKLFNKFVDLCILEESKGLCPDTKNLFLLNKLSIDVLIYLSDLGLFKIDPFLKSGHQIPSDGYSLFAGNKIACKIENKVSDQINFELGGYFLTTSGFEIAKLYRQRNTDIAITNLKIYINNKYPNLEACLYPIMFRDGNLCKIDTDNPIQ